MDEKFISPLILWMKTIDETDFEFETPEQYMKDYDSGSNEYLDELDWYYNVDMNNYIKLDDWINEFNKLIKELEAQLEKVKLMIQEDIERLNELEASNE